MTNSIFQCMGLNYSNVVITRSHRHQLTRTLVDVQTGEFERCSSKRRTTAGWHAYPRGEQPQPAGDDAHRGSASAPGCRRLPGHAGV